MNNLKVGFSRVDVTPMRGIGISGYTIPRNVEGILDNLNASAVALEAGGKRAVIISVDNLHISTHICDKYRALIAKATGIDAEAVFIHCTHTHTGPYTDPTKGLAVNTADLVQEYQDFLGKRLADVAAEAFEDLKGAKMGIAVGHAPNIAFVRRFRMKDGSTRTNPGRFNPDVVGPIGEADNTVRLVRIKREGTKDIAIVNFGTHPDCIGGTKYSADWPGVVRSTFEAAVGDGVKCLFLNGAQGDVNNAQPFPPPGRAALNAERQTRPKGRAIHLGRAVAGAALSVWDVCEEIPAGPVRGIVASHTMPANLPTTDEIKWVELFDAGRRKEIPLGNMEIMTLTSPHSRVRRMKKGPDHFDILVTSLAIGDSLAFAGLPGEPFVDIGRAVKARSPFRTTIVTCLTNGSEGYIPSTKAHADGGYEALSSRFAAPTGDELVDAQVEQLKALKGDAKSAARK